ncbi:putative transmembrane domain protein [Bacteroides fragilis str. S13 L11]|nr:putative transmembrane domain protein [Bacteroides fragilis str. 1007-1-F \
MKQYNVIRRNGKLLDASLPCLQVYHFVAHFLRLALSVR